MKGLTPYVSRGGRKGWRIQVAMGYTVDGEGKRKQRSPKNKYFYPTVKGNPHGKDAERQAEQAAVEFRRSLGVAKDDEAGLVSIRYLFDEWIEKRSNAITKKWSQTTLANHRRWADEICDWFSPETQVSSIDEDQIEVFIRHLMTDERPTKGKPLSANSVRRYHDVLRSVFNYAAKSGMLAGESPVKDDTRPDLEKHKLSPPNREIVQSALEAAESTPMWHSLLLSALLLSCRRGELLGLRWEDLDAYHQTVYVSRNVVYADRAVHIKRPKNGEPRTVFAAPEYFEAMNTYREWVQGELGEMPDHGYLFQTGDDPTVPLHPESAKTWWQRFRLTVPGLDATRFHDLRHFGGTVLTFEGVDAKSVQDHMGHHSPRSSEQYVHALEAGGRRAASVLASVILSG